MKRGPYFPKGIPIMIGLKEANLSRSEKRSESGAFASQEGADALGRASLKIKLRSLI